MERRKKDKTRTGSLPLSGSFVLVLSSFLSVSEVLSFSQEDRDCAAWNVGGSKLLLFLLSVSLLPPAHFGLVEARDNQHRVRVMHFPPTHEKIREKFTRHASAHAQTAISLSTSARDRRRLPPGKTFFRGGSSLPARERSSLLSDWVLPALSCASMGGTYIDRHWL